MPTIQAKDLLYPAMAGTKVRSYPNSELRKYDLNGWTQPSWLAKSVIEAARQAQFFINDYAHADGGHAAPHWLSFIGQSGCGKSHLARAIKDRCKEMHHSGGLPPQMWNCARVASMLRDGKTDLLYQLVCVPLLVLDDIGAEKDTDFIRGALYELLDARLNRWTIITSNLSLAEIGDRLDIRIASRLNRGHNIVHVMEDATDFDHFRKTNPEKN